ncbi:nucleotidyltransferase family protein [Asanoa iriomotensis]|uniref:Nucleotidyltransferase family protein n=1 Tax=Asanoa iriomotensis TaxID=234613 RepID=A0ABQ4C345_9ACTN|nr:nucleotidyltransferase family protein [Asanoa iriomotensis]GIF57201.1 hypothetical protein Air01nite_32960 [Asanoa iriomotensis]
MDTADLAGLVRACPWLMAALAAVRASRLPEAWIGAGVLRDLVWDERYGAGFDPARVRDVDVAFFDAADLSRDRDQSATALLTGLLPAVPWEATNQAAVHTWYADHFGGAAVPPLTSVADAVATWPETATSVAVRLTDRVEVCAPLGVADLLGGVWRPNPRRITVERSRERLARQRPATRWPGVRVADAV